MNLLIRGPHTVTVYSETVAIDSYGNVTRRPGAIGFVVHGVVLNPVNGPVRVGEDGLRRSAPHYQLVCRSAPLGEWSTVEWNGRKYSIVSGPTRHESVFAGPSGVAHIECIIREDR